MAEEVKFIFTMDDQFSQKAKVVEGNVSGLENALGKVALASTLAFAVNKVVDFGKAVIDAYAQQEVYESRLTTLLHDRKMAEIAIANIRKDAAKTPFDVGSLVQGNSMLIGAGASAKEARDVVMDLGNAIAATGGGNDELSRMVVNLGQIKSIGKASALDVKQFMYANIPIYQMLAENMKKTNKAFKNMSIDQIIPKIKEMDISYKDLTSALKNAREEGGMFNKGLENASMTIQGLKSNLEDTIETMKSNIGENFADVFKESLIGVTEELNNINIALANLNKTQRGLKKSDLGFNWMEKTGLQNTEQYAELNMYQKRLSEYEDFAQGGEKQLQAARNKIIDEKEKLKKEILEKNELAKINNKEVSIEDVLKFKRKTALLDESLGTLNSIGKASNAEKLKNGGANAIKQDKESAKVKQQQYTNITINIHDGLVHEFNVTTATIEGGAQNAKSIVLKGLIEAVNDSQLVAGI